MSIGLALVAALSLAGAAPSAASKSDKPEKSDGVPCGEATCHTFSSAKDAFAVVLAEKPAVLGIGEYHELEGAPKVKSAIKRFTQSMLPMLKGKANQLVVETWMVTGQCGKVEEQATAEVKKETQRPDSTEDEVTTLLGNAHDLGISPHILTLNCKEYGELLDKDGELDASKTLQLVGDKMLAKTKELLDAAEDGKPPPVVLLYGGALHNDLYPDDSMKDYCFGPALAEATSGHYIELDLLVPEYVDHDDDLSQTSWFAPALALARKGKTVLLSPKPHSYMLLFPASAPAAQPKGRLHPTDHT